jgi:AcrR family transcriptional regulator
MVIKMSNTRVPTQKRSIEKRNRIIEKGFELMCEKGYYNVSTPDIAEAAEVSTGIIYQYFNDKKDIFIEGVKNYANNILYPMSIILEDTNIDYNDIEDLFSKLMDAFIKNHTISIKAHEELMAMSHLDSDIAEIFKNLELLFHFVTI